MKTIKKITAIISLIFISTITISCDPNFFEDGCHSHIKFTNNSNTDICTGRTHSYPDTTFSNINPLRRGRKTVTGTTSTGTGIGAAGVCIESAFVDIPVDYISIFIFDAKFMEDNLNNEDFMANETMALQRYDLTLEDLNSLVWIIPYPPNEQMKDMKMYPPYGN